jgi:hypothetical protein
MPNKKTCFFGLLANTDSSILKVNLEHGFEIKEMPFDEGVNLIASLEKSSDNEVYKKLIKYCHFSESKLFFGSNSFETSTKIDGIGTSFSPEIYKFDNDEVYGYLKPTIQLMRLFREGNICMPLAYYFFMDYNTPQLVMSEGTHLYISPESYTLKDSEVPDLQKFILNTKLPFNESFLQLAFENFELSYQTHNQNMSFLSLMISLETLLGSGGSEKTYRISRNAAVLLGKDKDESEIIFSDIKKLYNLRSEIVHGGKSNIIHTEDLLKLRHYIRESIKEINKVDKSKDELLDVLNSCGFGDKERLKNKEITIV